MISIWHLLWIVPISAVGGVILTIGIVIFDDCLWLASDQCEKGEGEYRDNERGT